ncbi:6557_t:CDS:2 [Paraglomus occultum]|uniref:6557_t:CDS:1 n=1 Tax=Paraglomus occultum TaxID=144539 RepID=A0A9N8VKE3_9GLOM|nr:6557_t:CDS:2 [Paraglomus occultum]
MYRRPLYEMRTVLTRYRPWCLKRWKSSSPNGAVISVTEIDFSPIRRERERKLELQRKLKDEKLEIVVKLEKDCTAKYLRAKRVCDVWGALEFIRAQIIAKCSTISFREPAGVALKKLTEDQAFAPFATLLKKVCQVNSLRYSDVQRCLGGLYYQASKAVHGHKNDIVIDARDWAANEIAAIGTLFHYFNVPFEYYDESGDPAAYPYKFYCCM